ncbi:hypothetical protein DDZ13_12050 [Coraliomargarita sinensis]|uniref:Four helix bundle protein n=1 Tax=Coraliomargarita sinensis TaxID=2174842 RepID=A0A317ZI25_9BACT|nr:hypothetical protein DDZ13_12050 [Coraliomargarita sinensis]
MSPKFDHEKLKVYQRSLGKFTAPDRCRFFDIARGPALECAAALDVLQRKSLATDGQVHEGKECLLEIVSMLVGLVKNRIPRTGFMRSRPLMVGTWIRIKIKSWSRNTIKSFA